VTGAVVGAGVVRKVRGMELGIVYTLFASQPPARQGEAIFAEIRANLLTTDRPKSLSPFPNTEEDGHATMIEPGSWQPTP